jgi:hypothetical protein
VGDQWIYAREGGRDSVTGGHRRKHTGNMRMVRGNKELVRARQCPEKGRLPLPVETKAIFPVHVICV